MIIVSFDGERGRLKVVTSEGRVFVIGESESEVGIYAYELKEDEDVDLFEEEK